MRISLSFLLSFLLFSFFSNAQEIKVKNISKVKDYPLIELKIKQRDPKTLHKNNFIISENDSILQFNLEKLENSKSKEQYVLILVENLKHKDRLSFYKAVLNNSIKKINVNHKINIGVFDRVRKNGNQSVFLLLNNFTNNKTKLLQAIENIKPKNDIYSNNKSSDLYHAVYEGINILQKKEGVKSILLLSTAYNNKWSSHTSSESSKAFAIKNNIPIYSLQLRKQGFEHHKLTDLVIETYGLELITNLVVEATNFTTKSLNNLNNRLGNEYLINYKSIYNKDGNIHNSTININKKQFIYKVKTKNILKWFYYGIGLIILLFSSLIIKKVIENQNLKNKEKLLFLDKKIKQEQEKNNHILSNLNKQESIINKFKTEEEVKNHNEDLIKDELKVFKKMKTFGALPVIQYKVEGKETSYIIKNSIIFIGRAPTNHIIISDKLVSREHAKIYFNEGYFIKDLKSSTGTFINNIQVDIERLNHGNIIKLGNTQFTFIL